MLNQLFFLIWMFTLNICNGLPSDYCNHPFNRSNCGMDPTPVFAYYKPGSRCEIEHWRGCPTLNKFADEISCSYFCIGRLDDDETDEENEISNEDSESCAGDLNTEDCNKGPLIVYTYSPKENHCTKAKWRGCETNNKFSSKEACEKRCLTVEKLVNVKAAENILNMLLNKTDDENTETTESPVTENDVAAEAEGL